MTNEDKLEFKGSDDHQDVWWRTKLMRDSFLSRPEDYNGRTIESIADEFGVSRRLVRDNCNRCGIAYFKMSGRVYRVRDKFYDWLEKNEDRIQTISISQIAREVGISKKTASRCYHSLKDSPQKKVGRPARQQDNIRNTPLMKKKYEWEFKEYCEYPLERDDEYFDVITKNGALGISLAGDYWKRYREIAAKKWREGDKSVDLTRRRGRRRMEEDEDYERFDLHGYY